MRIETSQVGTRVTVSAEDPGLGALQETIAPSGKGEIPRVQVVAYDDPIAAIADARAFLDCAQAAWREMPSFALAQQVLMEHEHAAWLDVGLEFAAKGIDINEGGWSQLIYAIRKWGEELVQLRVGDPSHTEQALREAREAYEGQYERGTYPETIDRG